MFKKSAKIMSAVAAVVISAGILTVPAGAVYNPPVTITPVTNNYYQNVRFYIPTFVNGYVLTGSSQVNARIAQANYSYGNQTLVVRKAVGGTGISVNYPGTFRTVVSGRPVVYKGTRQGYYAATWSNGQYNYVVKSSHPLNMAQMNTIVAALINA
ncbi:MAG: hypothetical protein IJ080_01710 [Oscillospiraceae bacterium]|nr:hypothetical protein [Oscillospiraceae bacterium]MBQ8978459.1 hypothetical protein [Oscillospiraceae bacterium]